MRLLTHLICGSSGTPYGGPAACAKQFMGGSSSASLSTSSQNQGLRQRPWHASKSSRQPPPRMKAKCFESRSANDEQERSLTIALHCAWFGQAGPDVGFVVTLSPLPPSCGGLLFEEVEALRVKSRLVSLRVMPSTDAWFRPACHAGHPHR